MFIHGFLDTFRHWQRRSTPLLFRDDKDQHFELPTNMSNSNLCSPPTRRRLNNVHSSDMRIISEEGRHHHGHRILNPGDFLPLKLMNPWMNHDLRRIAIAIVGVHPTNSNHASHAFAEKYLLPESKLPPFSPTPATGSIYRVPIHEYYQNGPLHPNTQLDDVVIHYRCGDVIAAGWGDFGPFYYPKYEEYVKYISSEVKSIGIVTQPFATGDNIQARHKDHVEESGERCKYLVEGLIDYLKTHLYNKEIEYNIHGGGGG